MAQLADATNENGDVITSSPGPTPASTIARWSPAVPLDTAAQWRASTASATSSSKRAPVGPRARPPQPRARRPGRQPARPQRPEHELLVALVDPGSGERNRPGGLAHA